MRPAVAMTAVGVFMVAIEAGCAGTPMFTRSVYQDPNFFVRLERPLVTGTAAVEPNSHPAELTEPDLSALFRSVMVQRDISLVSYYVLRQDPKPERAFSDDEIGLIVPHVKTALAKARPEEAIAFFSARTRDGGVSEITSGGLFVSRDRIYLLLANVRIPVTTVSKMDHLREKPLASPAEPDFTIIPGAHQSLLGRKDPGFPQWAGEARGLAISYKAFLSAPRNLPEPPKAMSAPAIQERPVPSVTPPAPLPSSLDNKLRQLKAWRDQGLLSEQEYQEQKRKLLATF